MVAKTAFFLRTFGEDEAADRARLVVSVCMLIRAVGDIRLAQMRSQDRDAAMLACQKLDMAIGIQPAEEEWWKQVKRQTVLGADPWQTSSSPTIPKAPAPKRTL